MKQNFLSADLTFDLWQQPIGNGRRYCKIQYNGTGTGSYPLPVKVPSPVLLGVGARSRCRCSRHSDSVNYSTWNIQCKMALIKDGLWGIVSGSETAPVEVAEQAKFALRRDRALATIVLAVDLSLLYLIGTDPKDPVAVWKAFKGQFQRNTWANKLELKRKLFSLMGVQFKTMHIKTMTEVFDELSAIDEPVKEEDRVVYILASLPECYRARASDVTITKNGRGRLLLCGKNQWKSMGSL